MPAARRVRRRSASPTRGLARARRHRERERHLPVLGDAVLAAADEPGRFRGERDRRPGRELARRRDARQEQHLPLVPVVHERAGGQAPRIRPVDLARLEARREAPREPRRLARVAGVAPVRVPLGNHLQPERHGQRLARRDRGALGDQLRLDVRRAHRCGERGAARKSARSRAAGRTGRGIESLVALRRWKFRAPDDGRMTPGSRHRAPAAVNRGSPIIGQSRASDPRCCRPG